MHAKRSLFMRWVVVATCVALVSIVGVHGYTLLMPGPLTSAHATIGECKGCHTKATHGPLGLVSQAFMPTTGNEDSAKCLDCHITRKNALKPHGMASARLANMTKHIVANAAGESATASATIRKTLFPVDPSVTEMLPCATCHMEHRGKQSALTTIPESNCQTCHARQFAEFSSGHPEFNKYPYRRRTRIVFDHASHFKKHFPKWDEKKDRSMKAPIACVDCHALAAGGQFISVRSFDQTCSACHLDQIRGFDRAVGPRGVPFISVPGLDLRTLRERNIQIGNWPELSDANLTPIMKLLLAGDPATSDAIKLTAQLDLMDLRSASDTELMAVGKLAWAIKSLVQELASSGPAKFQGRLITATGKRAEGILLARLMGLIPRDVMLGMQRDWLPTSPNELAKYRAGEFASTPTDSVTPPSPQKGTKAANSKDQLEILGTAATNLDKIDSLIGAADQHDILRGIPIDGGSTTTSSDPPAANEQVGFAVDEEAYARLGGWYRRNFQLLFHPTGHADAFLKAWIDYSCGLLDGVSQPYAKPVFKNLTGTDAQGRCIKCHSIDRGVEGTLSVKWHPKRTDDRADRLTKFRHGPHLQVASAKGCITCHQLDENAKYLEPFAGTDPLRFASNFEPISRAGCVECHKAASASESCLSCHNYHVTPFQTPELQTKISDTERTPDPRQ